MKKLTKILDEGIAWSVIILLSLMVITVSWQVFSRYILNAPSTFTEELAIYMMIWVSLLGAVYALRLKAHLGIDILTRQMDKKRKRVSKYFMYGSVIVFSLTALIYGGIRLVYSTIIFQQYSAALQIPVGIVYLILPISGILMIYYSCIAILELWSGEEEEFTDKDILTHIE